MDETIHWQPHPTQRPEEFRARGTPWTTDAPRRKREDEYGPLPDLNALKMVSMKEENRRRGRPRLMITDEQRRQLQRDRVRLHTEMSRHPERTASIRERLKAMREMHSGQAAKALRDTGVG